MSVREIPNKRLDSVRFSTYSTEDLKYLSVKELTSPRSFDNLGHPTLGGLYDPALGPSDRDELCGTCSMGQFHCPGHMGHVMLPLPVFNPLFFPLVRQLLYGSCMKCHHLLAPRWTLQLVIQQLRCLDHGLLGSVGDLTELANQIVAGSSDGEMLAEEVDQCLKSYMKDALSGSGVPSRASEHARHIEESRRHVIQDFLRQYVASRGRKCRLCGTAVREIRAQHNSVILTKAASEGGQGGLHTVFLSPQEARNHLRQLMEKDGHVLSHIFGVLNITSEKPSGDQDQQASPIDQFFLEVLPVIPTKFRPVSTMGEKSFENPQTGNLVKVLTDCHVLRQILRIMGQSTDQGEIRSEPGVVETANSHSEADKENIDQSVLSTVPGSTLPEKLQNAWTQLQCHVNCVIDSDLDKISTDKYPGIKQLLERKEGLFRKHMMGKRVNYAARSVISPDPYINTDEIGIPEVIARRLTYPQPVTDWNAQQLRQMVMNGPDVHPGALLIENEDGSQVRLRADNQAQRESVAKRLLTPSNVHNQTMGSKKVHRHLQTGDIVLLNRQPTLHKPGIMAHKVRVLPGEKTLRLHYSSCKTYNADFDGDEMNVHFPQNELGRAEALTIASTNQQYLVPKDGTPLGGLIQDHIVSGVRMTVRGRLFSRHDYQQLVYCALTDKEGPVKCLPPCIRKPALLWSGKQLISTIIINTIPEGCKPLNFTGKSKINNKSWSKAKAQCPLAGGTPLTANDMSEAQVIVRNGELLCGVLDKGNYGPTPYGLIHSCYELYGGQVAGKVLSHLGRLFTTFLQQHTGFTLGPEDIIVTAQADDKRLGILAEARDCGTEAVSKALAVPQTSRADQDKQALTQRYEDAHRKPDGGDMKEIDLQMKTKTDHYSNLVSSACLGSGLLKQFPENNLQLVVLSGAKGSMVNCLQISCLLGQIELEGRRPPLMISGRSLPSFVPYETTPRSGGYVAGRFLTGIRPQEYFFHCMAGREGLVDTAVKTSRSGYLQRCIIKHLEGLVVNYDLTVRDSDGSVVQFQYGEDGLDILRTPFLHQDQFPFLMDNESAQEMTSKLAALDTDTSHAERLFRKIKRWKEKNSRRSRLARSSPFLEFCHKEQPQVLEESQSLEANVCASYRKAKAEIIRRWREVTDRHRYEKKVVRCPDPVISQMRPDRKMGAISERLEALIESYLAHRAPRAGDGNVGSGEEQEEEGEEERLRRLMYFKYQRALCEPGEAVGLLAAQSIGEPSTQMTLNTFHFAGRGEMNVTLGIPRLREILMVASANIKTPSMTVPFINPGLSARKVGRVRRELTRVHLSQVVEDVDIWESYQFPTSYEHFRVYKIRMSFLPYEEYKDELHATPASILEYIENTFLKHFLDIIKRKLKDLHKASFASSKKSFRMNDDFGAAPPPGKSGSEPAVADDESPTGAGEGQSAAQEGSEEEDEGGDGDGAASKYRKKHQEEQEYEDDGGEEEEEGNGNGSGEWEEIFDPEDGDEKTGKDGAGEEDVVEEEEEDAVMEEGFLSSNMEDSVGQATRRKKKMCVSDREKQQRIQSVMLQSLMMEKYDFDTDNQLWCEFTFKVELTNNKLDMASLLELVSKQATVHYIPGITRCLVAGQGKPEMRLLTEGVNLHELYKYDRLLELNKAYTNDIHAMANSYGIEAACKAIIKEVRDVFSVYGITVDPRHLSLVADYMTYEGAYRPFNRTGLETNASPLQKMTFESCMKFLREATIHGSKDPLQSPSARLVVGRVVNGGTGCFDLIQPLM